MADSHSLVAHRFGSAMKTRRCVKDRARYQAMGLEYPE
jgi:hypothetical protein